VPSRLERNSTDRQYLFGVAPVSTYEVKRVDGDYFSEEG
jgi:restriction endonuclease Mrr